MKITHQYQKETTMKKELVFRVGTSVRKWSDPTWYVFTNHTPAHKTDKDDRYYDKVWAQHLPSEEVANKIAFILQTEFNNSL
jgi:hypothetical protein